MRTGIEDNEHPGRKVTLDHFVVSFQGRLGPRSGTKWSRGVDPKILEILSVESLLTVCS